MPRIVTLTLPITISTKLTMLKESDFLAFILSLKFIFPLYFCHFLGTFSFAFNCLTKHDISAVPLNVDFHPIKLVPNSNVIRSVKLCHYLTHSWRD